MRKLSAKWVPKCQSADQKVNGASHLSNIWNFFGTIQMISCRDWWPWTKFGYIIMTRRQSNNQWSGGILARTAPKNSSAKIRWKSSRLDSIFWNQDGILLIDYLPKDQTINAEYYLSLLVQLKDIWKEKRRPREGHQGGLVLARECPGSPGICNPEDTSLPGLPVSWSPTMFSGSGPVGLPPAPWTEKTIEMSPFFVRRGSQCCRRNLVGRITLWIFFWVACKS